VQLNCMTVKLERLVSIVRASSKVEGKKAAMVIEGSFDLGLTWMWCTHLAESAEHVAPKARTRGIRLAAKEALAELAPLLLISAERGDPFLKVWESSARKYSGKNPRIPELRIAPEPPLRRLDGRPL
jgi:hypothetical protein